MKVFWTQRRAIRPLISFNETAQLDVSATGGPEGVTRLLQKLKMRSGITTISVNIPTFPANQSFPAHSRIYAS